MRFRLSVKLCVLILLSIFVAMMTSCDSVPHDSTWFDEENLTICQFLEQNKEEYSKSYRLIAEGKMLSPLCGYNPYGEDYTLFLPSNEAIEHFIQQNPEYGSFEELLLDTSFIQKLTRYHTVKRRLHTDEFPDGALTDSTLTGERLVTGFYTDGNNQIIKVNNIASITKSNLDMTNGYIHVISEMLNPIEVSGYEWLQNQDDYTILAAAMEFCRIPNRLWFQKYTILAEHDSIYHRKGIYSLEDLINYIAPPDGPANKSILMYNFTAYHVLYKDLYLNDLYWGREGYRTLNFETVIIDNSLEIKINPGIDTFGIKISEAGDTTIIDYIRLVREESNINTTSGPIHSITDLLASEPLP